MLHKPIFRIGETVYALHHTSTDPEMVFLVKGIITDILHDEDTPKYLIRIYDFYTQLKTLREYYIQGSYVYKFNDRTYKCFMPKFSRHEDLVDWLNNNDYSIVFDYFNVYRGKTDALNKYNKLIDFIISINLKKIAHLSISKGYKGKYKTGTTRDFYIKIRNFIFPKGSDEEFLEILKKYT